MTDFSSVAIPRPRNWQDFERHSRVLFEDILGDPQTQSNGRQGQPQHGVDIWGRRGGRDGPLVGVQCKGKDADFGKKVTETELKREVEKSTKFKPAIAEFILITTADDDAIIQEKARLLEQQVRAKGRDIRIAVWGWSRLQQEISQYPAALKAFHPDASPFTDQLLGGQRDILKELSRQAETQTSFEERIFTAIARVSPGTQIAADTTSATDSLDKHLHDQIDTYRDLISDQQPKTAVRLLTKLREQVWTTASPRVRFRILANLGAAHHRLGESNLAADLFLEASPFQPDDPVGIANKIAALLMKGRAQEAEALASDAYNRFPENADIALQRLQAHGDQESVENLWSKLDRTVTTNPAIIAYRIFALRESNDPAWETLAEEARLAHPGDQRFETIRAEAVLDRVLRDDPSALGVASSQSVTQADLLRAAETFEKEWKDALDRETPPLVSLAHNAALAFNILGERARAEALAEAAIKHGATGDETKRLRLSFYERKNAPPEALQLADSLSDTPQNLAIRADFRIETAPEEARALLAPRAAFTDRKDILGGAMVVIASYVQEENFNAALEEASRLQSVLPDDPHAALEPYRIKRARGDSDAEDALDQALARVTHRTEFVTRFLVAEFLAKAGRHDDVVGLLGEHTAVTHDSQALRLLVAAAANADRRSSLKELLDRLPPEVRDLPLYRSASIALAARVGDMPAAECQIRSYLALRPRNLEMHLQLMHALFRQNKHEVLRAEAAKPARDFDGAPEDFIKLAQFKDRFGEWREAHDLAYRTLLAHRTDPAVNMGYIGVFFGSGHSTDLDIAPSAAGLDMAVGLKTADGTSRAYVIEPDATLRPTPDYLAPSHKIAEALTGKLSGADIQLPDGTQARIEWIKPKVLHALHDILENFNNIFPDVDGLEKVRFQPGVPGGMDEVNTRLRERHDAIEHFSSLYDSGAIPLALTARALGSDTVATFLGLISSGHTIRVCEGTHPERDNAFSAIDGNAAKGCVLDPVTLHVVRRLNLEKAVTAVCGPIGIVNHTWFRIQREISEIEERINEPNLSLFWRDGQVFREEVTPEQKRAALDVLLADRNWIQKDVAVLPAQGTTDPGSELRKIIGRFGSDFVDEILAAQGTGRLLVCEDFALRTIARTEFDVKSSWLQPVMMKALATEAISSDEYLKAVLGFIASRFEFVSIDGGLLAQTIAGIRSMDLPKDFLTLASRLGGPKADLPSHVSVAARSIEACWNDDKKPEVLRQAMVGALLENLTKGQTIENVAAIIVGFVEFGRTVLKDGAFIQYLNDWLRGHFIHLP